MSGLTEQVPAWSYDGVAGGSLLNICVDLNL